jgi:hypothetical protein
MSRERSHTLDLSHALHGLAAAADECPSEVKRIHEAVTAARAGSHEFFEQVARLISDPEIIAGVGRLRSEADAQAHALARDSGDDDDWEIDWGEVFFVVLIFSL